MKILVSAFRPFGGRKNNTSEDILHALQKRGLDQQNLRLSFIVLPVNFRTAWPALRKAVERTLPDALLLLGEKSGETIAFETIAHNRRAHRKGEILIEKSKNKAAITQFNAFALATTASKHSRHQQPRWIISKSAGNYLCNFVYWKALTHLTELPCLFVHVPAINAEANRQHMPTITGLMSSVLQAMKTALKQKKSELSAQKQLTVPGQKAGRAKRKKGA